MSSGLQWFSGAEQGSQVQGGRHHEASRAEDLEARTPLRGRGAPEIRARKGDVSWSL